MTAIPEDHERYGGLLTTRGGRRVVAHYGRPERTYRAVRNVAGVIEHGFGVVTVSGPERRAAVGQSLTNTLPDTDGGVYGFVLEGDAIQTDTYVFDVGDRLLGVVPSGRVEDVLDAWSGSGRSVTETTRDVAVFGVYGPEATEAVASVCSATTPESALAIARGSIRDVGVTIIRDDGVTGEEGYLVVASDEDASETFDAMVNRGLNAAPFGYETWATLTLEAGTPLWTDLHGATPATVGVSNAFADGSTPQSLDSRLYGFTAESTPAQDATVSVDGEVVGRVTRSRDSPALERSIGFAILDVATDATWTIGDDRIGATNATLPFVEGSDQSARVPSPE
ncbi:MAG: glycine cleavage T C-terminal barrel domain-containing protein [Halorhabdus sp.]